MTDLGVMASMNQSINNPPYIFVATGFGKIVAGEGDAE